MASPVVANHHEAALSGVILEKAFGKAEVAKIAKSSTNDNFVATKTNSEKAVMFTAAVQQLNHEEKKEAINKVSLTVTQ